MISLLFIAVLAASAPTEQVRGYVQRILAGDLVAAAGCWREADLQSSRRLGIRYLDQPLKIDGDSPLWRAAEALCRGEASWSFADAVVGADGTAEVVLVLRSGDQEVRHLYVVVPESDGWRLASPVALAMQRLPATGGRYVTVRGATAGAALLDSCVADMAGRLHVPPDRLTAIAQAKFGYLCVPAAEVERLAGAPTVGVANFQHDVVITSHPCHAHELAHLVVNAWLGELPLFTLPLLQEGAATHLGGRWGRHPRVLDRVGRTTLADGFVSLDDLLTRDDFHAQSADVTYAAAAVFVGFLRERFGAAGLRAAYLACSGTAAEVAAWSSDDVQRRLAGALAVAWPDLVADFAAYVGTASPAAVEPGCAASPSPFMSRAVGDSLRIEIRRTEDTVAFHLQATRGEARGAILFGAGNDHSPSNDLFAEQFPGRPYHGERCGVLFAPDEVKVYDYRRQLLTGLHAEGFWPSTTYATADGRTLTFTIDRELLGATDEWELVLP